MVDVEVWWIVHDEDRPSECGSLKLPPGKAVSYYAGRKFKASERDAQRYAVEYGIGLSKEIVASLAPIDADLEEEGAPVALDDVVTYSSRLILRPRIPEADTRLILMYAHNEIPLVPVGLISFAAKGVAAMLELDSYDCAMTFSKQFLLTNLEGNEDSKKLKDRLSAARQLVKSKPPFKYLEVYVLSEYSNAPTSDALKMVLAQNPRGRRVDASAKVSEIIEPYRGRRRCHFIMLHQTRSADDPSAKPKGSKSAYLIFAFEHRQKLKNRGMSINEVAKKCSRLWDKMTPEAKKKYQALADEDKVRYEKEMDLYRAQSARAVDRADVPAATPPPPPADEPAATPPPAPELLTGAAGLLQILDEFKAKNGGVDDPYYAAMRGALEELEIEERKESS